MSDDEFDDDEPELDVEDLEEEVLDEDEEFVDEDEEFVEEDLELAPAETTGGDDEVEAAEAEVEDDEDVIVDLEEELHPDDVEEALDVVLRERTAKVGLEDEDEVDEEPDDRGEGGTRIVPRRPGEFLCSSCFLVLPRHQLADEKAMLCRDCA